MQDTLRRIVPPDLQDELGVEDWAWLPELRSEDSTGILERAVAEVSEDLALLRQLEEKAAVERNYRLTEQWTTASGEIFCSTVHSFKGLESPVVILAEIEPYAAQDLESLLYIGCSRACHYLVVLVSTDLPLDLLQRLGAG